MSEADRVQFFLRGTTLQSLLETYNNIDHNLASIRNVVKRQEEALPDLADTVEHHRRRVDAADRTARLQDSLNDVRHELAWAFVSESEEVGTSSLSSIGERY